VGLLDGLRTRRKHSKIDKLPDDLRAAVEQMLQSDFTYAEIVDYIKEQGFEISASSVWRYAQGLSANLQSLRMASENLRVMMEEIAKYPQLDTTEGIIRLLSHHVLEAIQHTPEEKWGALDPAELLKQAGALVRAASYKQRVDIQNKSALEAGYDHVKTLVFEAMSRDEPELYAKVSKYLERKKTEVE
jgi:non-canonical (house-cleaning) NTP pyrophosphatase